MNLIEYKEFKKTSFFFSLKPTNAIFIFLLFCFILIISIIIFSIIAPIDDIIKVKVELRPMNFISSVRCISEGEIVSINYKNGQIINELDHLLSLDTTSDNVDLLNSRTRQEQLKKDLNIYKSLLQTIHSNTISKEIKSSDAYTRSATYIYDYQRYKNKVEDAKKELDRELIKPKLFTSQQSIDELKHNYNDSLFQFNSWYNNQLVSTNENITRLRNELYHVEGKISDLERKIKNSTITAPIKGRIDEVMKLNIGDYIIPGEEILKIIPIKESTLKAKVYIDATKIPLVKINDEIKIRFPGLPPSRYGQISTKINLLPSDSTLTEDNKQVFIAEAIIETPYLKSKDGEKFQLLPGMIAEGRIIIDKSSIMNMVLRKLDFIR